jgi:hypothetical protein
VRAAVHWPRPWLRYATTTTMSRARPTSRFGRHVQYYGHVIASGGTRRVHACPRLGSAGSGVRGRPSHPSAAETTLVAAAWFRRSAAAGGNGARQASATWRRGGDPEPWPETGSDGRWILPQRAATISEVPSRQGCPPGPSNDSGPPNHEAADPRRSIHPSAAGPDQRNHVPVIVALRSSLVDTY